MGPGLGRTREICDLVDHILEAYEGAFADAVFNISHALATAKALEKGSQKLT